MIEQVLSENKGLITNIVKTFAGKGVDFDDLMQEAYLSIIKKYDQYDSTRGAITTFIHACIVNDLIEYTKRMKRQMKVPKVEQKSYTETYPLEGFREDAQKIVDLRLQGYYFKEIAKMLGISECKIKRCVRSQFQMEMA